MNRTDSRPIPWMILLVAALLPAAGCSGKKGPTVYDLQGTVQYDGKPVPTGEVFLQPDGTKGNAGPGSLALIKNGRYQTDRGKGIVGGQYIVRILGYDGVAAGDSTAGSSLFPQYEAKIEFPKEATTHDFNIPPSKPSR